MYILKIPSRPQTHVTNYKARRIYCNSGLKIFH
ncbi:hypothetical protein OIU79_027472 [Salix purpurea]|uniref:Uncharacterized protein n=1 Tax=Salix purpurea TaxID=77065 RepID=A0A9Q0VV18_SALPP|nr:hypothetical protein OIU79_027472 [Salix purpurea]